MDGGSLGELGTEGISGKSDWRQLRIDSVLPQKYRLPNLICAVTVVLLPPFYALVV